MAVFTAYNSALSATTAIAAGTSYASGAKIAIQLGIPANGYIDLQEWGFSADGSAAATPALLEVAFTATASTCSTAHTTATVMPEDMASVNGAATSRLTMGATATGYGNGAITSNTTLSMPDRQYIPPTGQYVKIFPEGRYPRYGNTSARYLQLRINTTATVNVIAYLKFDEHIL